MLGGICGTRNMTEAVGRMRVEVCPVLRSPFLGKTGRGLGSEYLPRKDYCRLVHRMYQMLSAQFDPGRQFDVCNLPHNCFEGLDQGV